jgi:NAD(P)-dependent dehydrogenase (short-subunit alcohol dehydrogenase family)
MNGDQKKIALVTGAATRIGRGIALSLAEAGWTVAVHFSKSEAAAQKTAAKIISVGGVAELFTANLRNENEVTNLVSEIENRLGPVTCLINNASIFEKDSVGTVTRETWDAHMEVNLRAPFVLSQTLANNLLERQTANIINIIDQRVLNLTPHFASYTISKSALWTLTRTLAIALAPRIRVNAIGPGPTLPSLRQSENDFEKQYNSLPLQGPVNISEICAAVKFILECPSMTGQLITIDGGQHLGWAQPGQDTNGGE